MLFHELTVLTLASIIVLYSSDLRPVTPPGERDDCETDRASGKNEGSVGSDRTNPLLMTAPAVLGSTASDSSPPATSGFTGRRFSRGSQQPSQRVITVGNTELLLWRLFNPVVEKDHKGKGIGHMRKPRSEKHSILLEVQQNYVIRGD